MLYYCKVGENEGECESVPCSSHVKCNLGSVSSVTYKGDRVLESGKSGHICNKRLKVGFSQI